MKSSSIHNFFKILGPGLMYAGAAVGVSHLVQSTRAGASYGLDLLLIIILINIIKYPFFEISPRYVSATGNSLLQGYQKLGKIAIWLFGVMTIVIMFPILGAISMVTAGIFAQIFFPGINLIIMTSVLLLVFMMIVLLGHYKTLDKLIKWIILTLSASTIISVLWSAGQTEMQVPELLNHFDWLKRTDILFLIALIGWMPSPIDSSVWTSMWLLAKQKQMNEKISLKDALLDFRVGYWGTALLAVAFLMLGAFVMFNSGEELSPQGAGFAAQLINLYTASLGSWTYPIIALAALLTMTSTSITVIDACPRVLRQLTEMTFPQFKDAKEGQNRVYRFWLFVLIAGTLLLISYLSQTMRFMVDMATTISFITAPILAFMNYKVITGPEVKGEARLSPRLRIFSIFGIVFLTVFSLLFLIWRFFI